MSLLTEYLKIWRALNVQVMTRWVTEWRSLTKHLMQKMKKKIQRRKAISIPLIQVISNTIEYS